MMRTAQRFFAAVALAFCGATAAQNAGQIQFVSGSAEIERGTQKLPMRATEPVLAGDTLVTGDDGFAQLRMIDSAFVSLRSRTRMRVEQYRYDTARPANSSAVLRLVNGMIRTFTGEIVDVNRANYRMVTPLASVGIRGSGNILAHLEDQGTVNHTLTGAHAVSALDPAVGARTLVSHGGQTIQVLPGQAPRYIPTPRFILAAATSKPGSAKSDDKASEPAAVAGGGEGATSLASAAEVATSVATSAALATTATSGAMIGAVALSRREAFIRFFNRLPDGTFEIVLGQSQYTGTGGAVVNSNGELVGIRNGLMFSGLSGPGALPPGYQFVDWAGDISFSGGVYRDAFQSPGGEVSLGRIQGGTVSIADPRAPGGSASYDLGTRSIAYTSTRPTHLAIWGPFTGSSTYSLAAVITPTDSSGNTGSVTRATTTLNFSSRIATGDFSIAIGGRTFDIAGNAPIDASAGPLVWSFASILQTATLTCTGSNCASSGYRTVFNGELAGAAGDWATYLYRINANRAPGSGLPDFVVGGFALHAATPPGPRIVMPQSGTANLMITGRASSTPTYSAAAFGPPINNQLNPNLVSGTLQANFSAHTIGFNVNVGSNDPQPGPTYNAAATNVPLAGSTFTAVAGAAPSGRQGTMTVTCVGSLCGQPGTGSGRFDGYFTNSTGSSGVLLFQIGDSLGQYFGDARFSGTVAPMARRLAVADAARSPAARDVSRGAPFTFARMLGGGRR